MVVPSVFFAVTMAGAANVAAAPKVAVRTKLLRDKSMFRFSAMGDFRVGKKKNLRRIYEQYQERLTDSIEYIKSEELKWQERLRSATETPESADSARQYKQFKKILVYRRVPDTIGLNSQRVWGYVVSLWDSNSY